MSILSFRKSLLSLLLGIITVSLISGQPVYLFTNVVNAQSATNPNLTPEQEAALRTQLAEIEKEIQEQQAILGQKQGEAVSITRDIAILDAKIKEAQLKIKAHNIAIQQLGKDITVKAKTIDTLEEHIQNGQDSLSEILDKTHQFDSYTLPEVLLAKRNISDFFVDVDSYGSVQESLKQFFTQVRQAKADTESQKEQLNQKRNQEIDTKVDVQKEEAKIQKNEGDKKYLLGLNKQQQKNYQSVIADKQAKAAQIKNALFALRDSASIKFGDAVAFAREAGGKTGVDPAFLLAIITQESNLGENVGSCYLTDTTSGSGIRISSGATVANVMKPSRDVQPFLNITKALGRDPFKTRVSCPFQVGYGGAMGPSQFIPSTWVLFQDRITSALGKAASDPWNPEDAFMASAMYLSDLGANAQTYTAERNAACKYYSGKSCSGSNTFYGNQVLAKKSSIQGNIDVIDGK